MKQCVKYLLHLALGLRAIRKLKKHGRSLGHTELTIAAQPRQLNRYLLNAVQQLPTNITVQLETKYSNIVPIGELVRSGQLGSELLNHPQVTSTTNVPVSMKLDIDYFTEKTNNRLPIWGHPKFEEKPIGTNHKSIGIVFAGSQQPAYSEFNEILWGMPNRLRQLEFISKEIPNIQVYNWLKDSKAYASLLNKYSHFLCLPGYRMPLCHNLYESIQFGCVPVIHSAYRKWLEPELKEGTNSFQYSTMAELRDLSHRIISGELHEETQQSKTVIKQWIDNNFNLEKIIEQAKVSKSLVLCAEEISVEILENRTS